MSNTTAKYDKGDYQIYNQFKELLKAVNTLDGLLKGINIDGVINEAELEELTNWCILQQPFIDKYPFKEIVPLVESYIEDGELTEDEYYDIRYVCNKYLSLTQEQNVIQMSMQTLHGILHGILADNIITFEEAQQLNKWLNENDFLQGLYPFDELCSMLTIFLKDGVLDSTEASTLKAFIGEFVDTRKSINVNEPELESLRHRYSVDGICAMCPDISFPENLFCFTGKSYKFNRNEFAEKVTELNGIFRNNVSKKLNYLVVGSDGNPCWAYSCYGRKIEEAVRLRKDGVKVLIVHENDFNDAVEDSY